MEQDKKVERPQNLTRRRLLRAAVGLTTVGLLGRPKDVYAHPGNPLNPIFGEWDETAMVVGGLTIACGIIIATGKKSSE
jgi:hypothetical protein